jgi:hypothetical protein
MMQPTIQNTADLVQSARVKVLTYGKAGMGKTHLISTADRPFVLSAESGLLTLRKFKIPYTTLKTRADVAAVFQWLQFDAGARANIGTVCLDSLTEIADIFLAEIKASCKDGRQQYGMLADQMNQVIRDFRDLDYDVYMSAQQEYDKDDYSGMMINRAKMPGKQLGASLPYFFDEVFQLTTATTPQGQSYRVLRTQGDTANDAKDRSGCLAPVEEPHLGKIFAKIKST